MIVNRIDFSDPYTKVSKGYKKIFGNTHQMIHLKFLTPQAFALSLCEIFKRLAMGKSCSFPHFRALIVKAFERKFSAL